MKVRILKSCYCVHLKRQVYPGEIVDVPGTNERRAIEAGLVEMVIEVPQNVPDMPGTYD